MTSPVSLLAALGSGDLTAPEGVVENPVGFLAALVAAMQGQAMTPVADQLAAPESVPEDQANPAVPEQGADSEVTIGASGETTPSTPQVMVGDQGVGHGVPELDPTGSRPGSAAVIAASAETRCVAQPAEATMTLPAASPLPSPAVTATEADTTDSQAPGVQRNGPAADVAAPLANGGEAQAEDVGCAARATRRPRTQPDAATLDLGVSASATSVIPAGIIAVRAPDRTPERSRAESGPATVAAQSFEVPSEQSSRGEAGARGRMGRNRTISQSQSADAAVVGGAGLASAPTGALFAPASIPSDFLEADAGPGPQGSITVRGADGLVAYEASTPAGTRDATRALPAWAFVSTLKELLGEARILEFRVSSGSPVVRDGPEAGRATTGAPVAADATSRDSAPMPDSHPIPVEGRLGSLRLAEPVDARGESPLPIRRNDPAAGRSAVGSTGPDARTGSPVPPPGSGQRALDPDLIMPVPLPAARPRELHATAGGNLPADRQEVPTGNGTAIGTDPAAPIDGRTERRETSDAADRASDARPDPGTVASRGDPKPREAGAGEARNLPDTSEAKQQPAGLADRVAIRLADGDGRETRIRVTVIGDQVRATIQSSDPEAARYLEHRMDELQAALVRQGYVDSKVTVQGARAEPVTIGAGAGSGPGDAVVNRGSQPSSSDDRQGTGRRDQQRQQGGQDGPDQRPRDRDNRDRRKGRDA